MSRRKPPRIIVDGGLKVILDPDEYDKLARASCKLGGQMNRHSFLKQRIRDLDAIAATVAAHTEPDRGDCPLCRVRGTLTNR